MISYCDGGTRVGVLSSDFLEERESAEKHGRVKNELVYTFSFSPCEKCREAPLSFPHQNKGFIKLRNWAVRNPAGTRLDSLTW